MAGLRFHSMNLHGVAFAWTTSPSAAGRGEP